MNARLITPSPGATSDWPRAARIIGRVLLETEEKAQWWSQISDIDRNYLLGSRNWPERCFWCSGHQHHDPLCDELRESWQPALPWGKSKGRPPSQVPPRYLAWFHRHCRNQDVKDAIVKVLRKARDTGNTVG